MRTLASYVMLLLASLATAQSPLVTLAGGTNQGNVGNNVYFNLQILQTVTISQIDFLCGANTIASANGILDIYIGPTTYVGNELNAALWTQVATTGPVTVTPSATSLGVLQVPLCLGPGNYGVALKSNNFCHGYSNGDGNATPGSGTNQTFTRAEMVLRAGANQNTPWSSALNTPRIFNGSIHFTQGGTPIAVAAWERYGQGCYKWFHSFLEIYPNPSTSFDLKNTAAQYNSLHMTFLGSGYLVGPFQNGTGTFYTPTAAATPLVFGANNSVATFTTPFPVLYPTPSGPLVSQSFEVSDNGYVSPAGSNGSISAPTEALFLSGNPRWAAAWFDFDPMLNAAGSITYETDPSNQAFYVTWSGVADVLLAGTLNTFQIMFTAGGDVEFRYGTMSLSQGGVYPCLTGWTPGGNVMNPGSTDISNIVAPFQTGPTDNPPLSLAASSRPLLGGTITLDTTDIPPSTLVGVMMLGFGQVNPGLPLAVIGMPDCFQLVGLNGSAKSLFLVSGTSASSNLPIPNNAALNGVRVYGQSLTLTPGYNTAGLIASNGVRLSIGAL